MLLMCGWTLLVRLPMLSAARIQRETQDECMEQDIFETKEATDHLLHTLLPMLSIPTAMSSLGAHTFKTRRPLILDSCLGKGTFGVVIKGHLEGDAGTPLAVKRSTLGECNSVTYKPKSIRNKLAQARRELHRYMRINAAKGEETSQPGSSVVPTLHDSAEGCVHGQYMAIMVLDLLPSHWPFETCLTAASSGQKQACPDLRPSEVDKLWRELTEGYWFLCNIGIAQSDGWIENQLVIKETDGDGHHVRLIDFDKSSWVPTVKDSMAPTDDLIGHCGYDLNILQMLAKAAEASPRWPPSSNLKRFFKALNKLGDVENGEGLRAPGPQGRRIKPLPKPSLGNLWNAFAKKARKADEVYRDLLKLLGKSCSGQIPHLACFLLPCITAILSALADH